MTTTKQLVEDLNKVFQNPETILQFTTPSPPATSLPSSTTSTRQRNPRRNGPKSNVTMTTVSMIPPAHKRSRLEDLFPISTVDQAVNSVLQDSINSSNNNLDYLLYSHCKRENVEPQETTDSTSTAAAENADDSSSAAGVGVPQHFNCHQCQKIFWSETSLKHHCSLYHSEKAFVCEICGKAFRFRSNLAEHRSVHTSLKPYVCKFCGKSSRLKGNLTKHILKHHKKEQNAYIGKDDIIIKKGKKSVKDPVAVDFLEKSMIVISSADTVPPMPSAALHLYTMAQIANSAGPAAAGTTENGANAAAAEDSARIPPESLLIGGGEGGESTASGRESSGSGSEFQGLNIDSSADVSSPDPEILPVESVSGGDRSVSDSPTPNVNGFIGGGVTFAPGGSTRCHLCGKHFRKAGSLRIHVSTKHGQSQTTQVPAAPESNGFTEEARNRASPRSITSGSTGIGIASPPPLKVGNHYALANGYHAATTSASAHVTSKYAASAESVAPPSVATTITPSPSLLSNDIRELKEVLREIRSSGNPGQLGAFQNASRGGAGHSAAQLAKDNQVISARLESLLLSLDTRVGRLEKQVESSVNSLYSLVQLQSSMNSAFSRFREDISGQLRSLQNLITLASSSISSTSSG